MLRDKESVSANSNVLKDYRFDIRDFSESQIRTFNMASACVHNNPHLRSKIRSTIKYQNFEREKYFDRVASARRAAYYKHLNSKIRAKLGLSESISEWYALCKERVFQFRRRLMPEVMSKYEENPLHWPEIDTAENLIQQKHIIAGMTEDCVYLTGWERVKQAFLPQMYIKDYSPVNPSHVFNKDVFLESTGWTGLLIGLWKGFEHAQLALARYKEKEAGELYESRYWAHRARQNVFMRAWVRYIYRWGWRAGFLYASCYVISQGLTIYSMEDRPSHYWLAAGITSSLYNWTAGPIGMLKYGIFGVIFLGVPTGLLLGKMGYNPRPILYHNTVAAKLSSPFDESNWPEEKKLLSVKRTVAILELLTMKEDSSTLINDDDVYREFFGQ